MSNLPTVSTPVYFLKLPSTGKEYKFRPYFVKEEKVMAMALQEADIKVVYNTIKEVIRACTFNLLDPEKITSYDLEYVFLQLRMKSKGEIVPLVFQCANEVKDADGTPHVCGHVTNINFDLKEIKVSDLHASKKIMLGEDVGVMMKYPTISELIDESADPLHESAKYIESIFDKDEVFDNLTVEEFAEFLGNLTSKQFDLIDEFFKKVPKLYAEIKIKCAKCGHEETVVLEGLRSFLEF